MFDIEPIVALLIFLPLAVGIPPDIKTPCDHWVLEHPDTAHLIGGYDRVVHDLGYPQELVLLAVHLQYVPDILRGLLGLLTVLKLELNQVGVYDLMSR